MRKRSRPAMGTLLSFLGLIAMGLYFTFAAVQGDFGIFRRVQVESELDALRDDLQDLEAEIAVMRNKTTRISNDFLDLDLLDHQARKVLGLIRADEILIQ